MSWRVWNYVDAPVEEEGDFGGAAGGGGAHQDEAGNAVDGVLDGFGDGDLHLLDGHDAVIDADDDAGKVGLREDGDGDLKRGVDAGEGEGEQKEEDGLGVTGEPEARLVGVVAVRNGRNGGRRGAHLSSASFPAGLSASSDFPARRALSSSSGLALGSMPILTFVSFVEAVAAGGDDHVGGSEAGEDLDVFGVLEAEGYGLLVSCCCPRR